MPTYLFFFLSFVCLSSEQKYQQIKVPFPSRYLLMDLQTCRLSNRRILGRVRRRTDSQPSNLEKSPRDSLENKWRRYIRKLRHDETEPPHWSLLSTKFNLTQIPSWWTASLRKYWVTEPMTDHSTIEKCQVCYWANKTLTSASILAVCSG